MRDEPTADSGDDLHERAWDRRDAEVAARWLRGIARDLFDHGSCYGCRVNAAQALDELGLLQKELLRMGIDDPRLVPYTETPGYVSREEWIARNDPDSDES